MGGPPSCARRRAARASSASRTPPIGRARLLGRDEAAARHRDGLVHRPRVLFLDEPTTGLDPRRGRPCGSRSSGLPHEQNLTILLTTHYLEEADRLAERVAIVSRGRVVVEGTPGRAEGGATRRLRHRRARRARRPRRRGGGDRRRGRGRARRPRSWARSSVTRVAARGRRRCRRSSSALESRGHRRRVRDDRAAVARRRLPPLHGPRVRRRGPGGDAVDRRGSSATPAGWSFARRGT